MQVATIQDRGLQTVMFTDIEGFSALTQEDAPHAFETVQRYKGIVTDCTEEYHGEVIHFFGDGSLSVHPSTYEAVQCAIEMQRRFSVKPAIPVRIGIHLGEIVRSDESIFGNAVNIASRIQDLASSRSILVSGSVERELQSNRDISLSLIGREKVKNIKEPLEVFAVNGKNLVTPTRSEIHLRNKARRRNPYMIALLLVLLVGLTIALDTFGITLFPKPLAEKRILVEIPFVNNTGDPSLDELTRKSAEYISTALTSVEKLKLVNIRTYYDEGLDKIGGVSLKFLSSITNAEVFVQGNLNKTDNGSLVLSYQLVDRDYKVIKSFSEQPIDPSSLYNALENVADKIAGYILSADRPITSAPHKDAFEAYMQAIRVWTENNYEDSRRFLEKAIEYDPTFLDAYYLLIDTYFNISEFESSDSILNVVASVVPPDEMSSAQLNDYYYYQALLEGDNLKAYNYLKKKYELDKRDPFLNNTTAGYAMFFLNAPREAISVLKKLRRKDVNYTTSSDLYRIETGIQAYSSIGKYGKAADFADEYPEANITLAARKMQLRAYIGEGDMTKINNILTSVRLNRSGSELVDALYFAANEFTLHENDERCNQLLAECLTLLDNSEVRSFSEPEIRYRAGDLEGGLNAAKEFYWKYPDWIFGAAATAMGYAYLNQPDSTQKYLQIMQAPGMIEMLPGERSYKQARIFTVAGDYNSALVQLRSAVGEGFVFVGDVFFFDAFLTPLFDMPEFEKVAHPLDRRTHIF